MDTIVDEIAPDIFRMSTWVPDVTDNGFTFNQFLLTGDEPFLFHCGHRQLFPLVSEAVNRVMPLEKLRWISFGHVEADECGAVNLLLDAVTGSDCVAPALEAEAIFHATGLTTNLGSALQQLAELNPTTLAIMHGSSYAGDGAAQLRALADGYAAMAATG